MPDSARNRPCKLGENPLNLGLTDLHDSRYLHTRCAECQALITINAAAAQIGGLIYCWQCNAPARIWQLIGRANRQGEAPPLVSNLGATWEGARP